MTKTQDEVYHFLCCHLQQRELESYFLCSCLWQSHMYANPCGIMITFILFSSQAIYLESMQMIYLFFYFFKDKHKTNGKIYAIILDWVCLSHFLGKKFSYVIFRQNILQWPYDGTTRKKLCHRILLLGPGHDDSYKDAFLK